MSGLLQFRAALFACLACMSIPVLAPLSAHAGPPPAPNTFITQGPSNQHITTDRTPTFHFTSNQAGVTFECQLDGAAFTACTSPHTTAPLSDGRHDFYVRAVNGALVADPTPAHRAFYIDHDFVPDTVLTDGPAQGSTTADDTPTFAFAAASWHPNWGYPVNHHATTFTCSIDGGPWFGCASPYTTPSLTDGSHTFSVRATRDGRTDQSPATRTFTVDRGIPDTAITGGPTEGSVTTDPTPTFSFTSTRAGSTFTCIVDGLAAVACSSPVTTAALADGTHTFSVAATSGGQTDPTPALRTFVIDQPEPAVASALPPLVPLPTGAAATPPMPASKVSIVSAAGRIGATGATRLVLRCGTGSGECEGRLRLVKTVRMRCGERFCFLRKTLASTPFVIASGSRKAITPQLTTEAIRLVRSTRFDRLLVLAVATSDTNQAQKAVLLIGRAPA